MLQHPDYIPELLQNPDGFVRQSACEAARKGGQSKAIVDAVCAPDSQVPWPTAEALHGSDHLDFVSGLSYVCFFLPKRVSAAPGPSLVRQTTTSAL